MRRLLWRPGVLLIGSVALAGCSNLEFNRPFSALFSDRMDLGESYLDPGKSPNKLREERLAQIVSARARMPVARSPEYLLGPGDQVEVKVYGLVSADKVETITYRVSAEGHVILPLVGRVTAGGLSVSEFVEAIREAYAGKYLRDPQVTANVTEFRSVRVKVAGAVAKPGVYYLERNVSTVVEILALAGGVKRREAGGEVLVVRVQPGSGDKGAPESEAKPPAGGTEQIIHIGLKELLEDGNPLYNLDVIAGDTISVPPLDPQSDQVYILGYVNRPTAVPVRHGRIDAFLAVARAGGLNKEARAENSYVVRQVGETRRALVVPVDLTKIARGVRPHLYLKPGDTLVVGSSVLVRLAAYVRPTASAGASMSFIPP